MLYIPILSFTTVAKTSNLQNPAFIQRFKTFIVDLRTTNPLCFHFMTVFFFRRAVFACCFVLVSSWVKFQIISVTFTVLGMMVYLALVRPYKSTLSVILSLTNEILLLVLVGTCFRFIDPVITPRQSKMIGTIQVALVITTIVVNWGGIVTTAAVSYIKKTVKKKKVSKVKELERVKCNQVSFLVDGF